MAAKTAPRQEHAATTVNLRLAAMALLGLAVCACAPAEPDPIPPPLVDISRIDITVTSCRDGPRQLLQVREPRQVQRLVAEMQAMRASAGISAAKIACSVEVLFGHDHGQVATVHVFPGSAMELAPVSGTRYFQYRTGLDQLPELGRLVSRY